LVKGALEHQNELSFDSGGKEQAVQAYEEALNAVFDLRVECHQHIQPYASRKDGTIKWALLEMWPLLVCSSTQLIKHSSALHAAQWQDVQSLKLHTYNAHMYQDNMQILCADERVTSSLFFLVQRSETMNRICVYNATIKFVVTSLLLYPIHKPPIYGGVM